MALAKKQTDDNGRSILNSGKCIHTINTYNGILEQEVHY